MSAAVAAAGLKAATSTCLAACFPHASPWPRPALEGLRARPAGSGDRPFLQALYTCLRKDEMAATGWPPEVQARFLGRQFDLQQRHQQSRHADAQFLLMLREGRPLGCLSWRADPFEILLLEISLVPEERRCGIGSGLMSLLVSQADALGQSIAVQVDSHSQAPRFYRRFGFDVLADNGVDACMRRPVPVRPADAMAPCAA